MRKRWLAMMATLAAAAMAGGAERAEASCIRVVVWHDTAYFDYSSLDQIPGARAGTALDGALIPDCNDTGGSPGAPSHVDATRLAGLPPDVAIVSEGEVLVSTGYLPQTPGFPLKREGSTPLDETGNCVVGPARTVDGTVETALYGVSVRRPSGGLDNLLVDSHTKVVGLRRHGLPFIGHGQRVHIVAVPCQMEGANGPKIIARRITAAGPITGPENVGAELGEDWNGDSALIPWRAVWIAAILAAAAFGGWALHRRLG
jgi:Family of unknown function (DUF6281)